NRLLDGFSITLLSWTVCYIGRLGRCILDSKTRLIQCRLNTLFVPKRQCEMRILNVAEKNDAAKNIAEILSGGRINRREGLSKFNKIYEFAYNFGGAHATMVMTSVSGHLLNYEFSPAFKSWYEV
ncbi:hypothetical protein X801_03846, partial [Opisthorchis viverrini]